MDLDLDFGYDTLYRSTASNKRNAELIDDSLILRNITSIIDL